MIVAFEVDVIVIVYSLSALMNTAQIAFALASFGREVVGRGRGGERNLSEKCAGRQV